MRCTKCQTDNREGRKFCSQCGSALSPQCPRCGAANQPGDIFCGDCGTALASDARATASPARASSISPGIYVVPEQQDPTVLPEGERKTVTALFADIKGSTELMEELDPEEARAIVDPALTLMMEAVNRYGGYIVQSTGDGIFAMFGAPLAHEDHPQRALYAGLRMQEDLRRYGAKLRERGFAPIEIRIGVNTGEVVVRAIQTAEGRAEYTPIGHSANLASRMQAVAATGSIAVTENTRKFCEGYFTFRSLGPTRIKGLSETVNVHEVTGLGPLRTRLQASARRGLSKFVGRETELTQMKRALELAKSGRGQIVAAVGEAGVGKSRLFYEFQAVGQPGCLVLETLSVSHGRASAYLPVVDLLRNYFDIVPDDDARKRREKIGGKILMLDRALEDTLPYLFTLLEVAESDDQLARMDSELRRRRTLDAIKRLLLRESLNQPLIVIFEDLHWLDDGSRVLLNLLADSIGTARVLMLVNYRPEFTHNWGNKTYYTQLRLDPLGAESGAEMLEALLGAGPELAPLKRVILEKTEGNPFFMEEIVQALFEQGALLRNGSIKLAKPLSAIQIPSTVQAVLASRIDRLPAQAKELLQTLAVIGKEFPFRLVREVSGKADDEVQRLLSELQIAEFIYEQPAVSDVAYVFKHALSQQVAYGSALLERRRVLHERIARSLAAQFPETVETQPELIAHHFTEAGLGAEAIPYWQRAGERALRRFANVEAIGHLTRALDLRNARLDPAENGGGESSDERRRCMLLLALGEAQKYAGAHLEAQETFLKAANVARALESLDLLVRAALNMAKMSTDFGIPAATAASLLEYAFGALGAGDDPLKVKILAGLAQALGADGMHQRATEYALHAVAAARRLDNPELLAESLLGAIMASQGPAHAEQRFAYAAEVVQLCGSANARWHSEHPLGHAQWWLLYSLLELGDMPAVDAAIDEFDRAQERFKEPFGLSLGLAAHAMRALMQGRFADSEHLAQEAAAVGQQLQSQNASGVFALQMFTLRREQGRLKELEAAVRFFVQQESAAATWRPGLAVIYSELGLVAEAREQFESLALHNFADLPRDSLWLGTMTYLVDVCTFLGDRNRADILYQILLPLAGRNVVVSNAVACYGALSRYLGALATTLGRWDESERHFEDALAMNARMEALPWLAHTQEQYATMLLARDQSGDRDKAADLLNAALATAQELGMPALEERVTARITRMTPDLH